MKAVIVCGLCIAVGFATGYAVAYEVVLTNPIMSLCHDLVAIANAP